MTASGSQKTVNKLSKIIGKVQRKAAVITEPQTVIDSELDRYIPQSQLANMEKAGSLSVTDISKNHIDALKQSNFALWASTSNILVDHDAFEFSDHKYMLPMYLDRSQEIVLMKSAQMGATIWMLLKLLWFCRYNDGVKACLFFPTDEGVSLLSKDRLTPLIHSNADLLKSVQNTDNIGYKKIGNSSLYLRHLGGIASKDSTPFDFLAFDEVRLVQAKDVDQARERVSHSKYKQMMFASTAGAPGCDIDLRFKLGTQNYFHTRCNCTDGIILSDVFPDCVAVTEKEVYYICPRCKMRITDPQDGRYISHNPGAPIASYHIHQMLSKFISAAEVWRAYQTTQNKKEFYNAKLGKPYVDEENVLVKVDDLNACENLDISWQKSSKKARTAMGVDQMSGYNYVVICEQHPNKKRVVHFEIIDSDNPIYWEAGRKVTPFKRVHQLMKEFDVDLCIIDAMPNANEAMEFARAFPRRVFVSWYIESQRELVQWGDRPKFKTTVKKGGPRVKFKYTALMSRFLSIEFALEEIANRNFEWPCVEALQQQCRVQETGRYEVQPIFRTHAYKHFTGLCRQRTVIDESTGRYRMEFVNLGGDPHSSHALNYVNLALERLRKAPVFSFGNEESE